MRKSILRAAVALAILLVVLGAAAWAAARHFQPYVRALSIRYLEDRFGTAVELGSFRVLVTVGSLWKLETAVVRVSGDGLVLSYPSAGLPPLIKVGKFRLHSDLSALWRPQRRIREIQLEEVEINIPPREKQPLSPAGNGLVRSAVGISVDQIQVEGMQLRVFASDTAKQPRVFDIHQLRFQSAGPDRPLRYQATLMNPTPPGDIDVSGEFGPWQKDDPGLTRASGDYQFRRADLAVFRHIGGTLSSTGRFHGVLRRLEVDGRTETPDFRLTGGNPVPLTTRFHSIVDGTTGNTLLQPVDARLGSSHLSARGSVIRPRGTERGTVALDVVMTGGRIEDLLLLSVKSPQPLMRGEIGLRTKMEILPQEQAFDERLVLDGTFDVEQALFTGVSIQEKIDSLSRRAQGKPKDQEISEMLSYIGGGFNLRDGEIRFSALTFQVPGAAVHLKGSYGLDSEQIDLHGVARLRAKVSQTMTGWKRIALKPVDPFFSKAGAGTLLPIKVTGTREKPEFGLDRGARQKTGERTGSADRRLANN
jgi:hypothetical protein